MNNRLKRALKIDEASFGADHPNVATGLNNLAQLHWATNRLDLAEPLARRAYDIMKTSLGEEHPKTRTVLGNLKGIREELAKGQ